MTAGDVNNSGISKYARRVIVIGALLIGVMAAIVYTKVSTRKASHGSFAADRQRTREFNASIDTPEANDAFINKAMRIRSEWHTWASAHASYLKRMSAASPGDLGAFDAVYDIIPSYPTAENCGIPHEEVSPRSPLPFTWNAMLKRRTKHSPVGDPLLRAKIERGEESYFYQIHDIFKSQHDIKLSCSVKTGAHQVVVWASGRVTQVVLEPRTDSRGTSTSPVSTDISPRYEDVYR